MTRRHHLALPFLMLLASGPGAQAGMGEALSAYAKGDYEQAALETKPLAAEGNKEALRLLAEMHENGRGVIQNDALAWAYYNKAAMGGDAESQFRLGQMYEKGQGVPQNFSEAVKWYQRASLSGHTGAKARLGRLTMAGRGGKVSFNKGLALIEEAALMGEPEAETQMADLERRGLISARRTVSHAPPDAESAALLEQAQKMVFAFGAPFPLGPNLKLNGQAFVANRSQGGWTIVLPKPEIGGTDSTIWQAASIRMTVQKTSDGKLDARLQLPALWQSLGPGGQEAGRIDIGSQSVTGLWLPDQQRWTRHNVQLSALKLTAPEGEGTVGQLTSVLETMPAASGVGIDLTQTLRLSKGEFKNSQSYGVTFDQMETGTSLKNLDMGAYAAMAGSPNAAPDQAVTLLAGFASHLNAAGLRLTAPSTIAKDIAIGSLSMTMGADDLDQPTSRMTLGLEALDMSGNKDGDGPAMLPPQALPSQLTARLSSDHLPLHDLTNQLTALFIPASLGKRQTASAVPPHAIGDTAFDAMATLMDTLVEAGTEIRIDEISAKANDWGISAQGVFVPNRGQALPFSGKLTLKCREIDKLIKALDDGSSFAAVMLDGVKRTSPPQKDEQGDDVFEVTFGADGAIDINGQRWSQPDQPAKKPGNKPVPLTKKK